MQRIDRKQRNVGVDGFSHQRINVNGIGRFHYPVYINPLVIKQDARPAKKANLRMDFLPKNTSSVASYQSVAPPMKFHEEPSFIMTRFC